MALNKIVLFSFLTFFATCNGQVTTHGPQNATVSAPSPVVIRNSDFKGIYPDFDTTLVGQYILSIFQDSKGNLWFGTGGEGTVRYDKKSLRYYTKEDGFTGMSVFSITEDKKGDMWFGTEQGLFKYDGKTFKNYKEISGLTNIKIGRRSILEDKNGTLWVGTGSGVFRYDPAADTNIGMPFSQFPLLPSTVKVKGIMEDKTGNIWFSTEDSGVYRFDGKTVSNISEKEGLSSNYSGGMLQDNDGNFWFTLKDSICRYDGKTFMYLKTQENGSDVWGIYQERSGIIWISARGSMTRFDPSLSRKDPKALTVFKEKDGINCCIQSMYQDQSGTMWWGGGSGLYRFDGNRFYQVKQKGPW